MNAEPQISITLSPVQIEEIVCAADPGRAPGFAALIAAALGRSGEARVFTYDDRRLSRSLLRGLAILTCFGPDEPTLGLMEIAERLQISASTIHRYVITLVEVGLLEQSPKTRKYSLPSALRRRPAVRDQATLPAGRSPSDNRPGERMSSRA